jgi:hypothetical protein
MIGGIVLAALSLWSAMILIREAIGDTPPDEREPGSSVRSQAETGTGVDLEEFATIPPLPARSPSESQPPSTVEIRENDAAGFLFSYPAEWELDTEPGMDRLTNPSHDVVMMFEVAPAGTLRSASDRVVEEVTKRYSDIELDTSTVERTPQGLPSQVVGGRGVDTQGATARFVIITIHGRDGNRAITVHFSPGAQPLQALPVIREVIASYRISTA